MVVLPLQGVVGGAGSPAYGSFSGAALFVSVDGLLMVPEILPLVMMPTVVLTGPEPELVIELAAVDREPSRQFIVVDSLLPMLNVTLVPVVLSPSTQGLFLPAIPRALVLTVLIPRSFTKKLPQVALASALTQRLCHGCGQLTGTVA